MGLGGRTRGCDIHARPEWLSSVAMPADGPSYGIVCKGASCTREQNTVLSRLHQAVDGTERQLASTGCATLEITELVTADALAGFRIPPRMGNELPSPPPWRMGIWKPVPVMIRNALRRAGGGRLTASWAGCQRVVRGHEAQGESCEHRHSIDSMWAG